MALGHLGVYIVGHGETKRHQQPPMQARQYLGRGSGQWRAQAWWMDFGPRIDEWT